MKTSPSKLLMTENFHPFRVSASKSLVCAASRNLVEAVTNFSQARKTKGNQWLINSPLIRLSCRLSWVLHKLFLRVGDLAQKFFSRARAPGGNHQYLDPYLEVQDTVGNWLYVGL